MKMGDAFLDTQDILKVLTYISGTIDQGVYLLRGFKPFLENTEVQSHLISLVDRLNNDESALFFTGKGAHLEDPLKSHIASLTLPLPTENELLKLLKQIYQDLSQKNKIEINISKKDLEVLILNLKGLSLFEAKKILTMVMVEDGILSKNDIQKVIESKKRLIEKEGVLEYYTPEESFADIASLKGLKDWLKKRQYFIEKPDQAKKNGTRLPKRYFVTGCTGTGKVCAQSCISRMEITFITNGSSKTLQ